MRKLPVISLLLLLSLFLLPSIPVLSQEAEAVPAIQPAGTPAAPSTAPILPAIDPATDSPELKFAPNVAGKHPRLLITTDRIAPLRAFYTSEKGALYREHIERFVKSCTVPADLKVTALWGQDIGIQKMPTVALHYVLTGDKDSYQKCVDYLNWLVTQPNWSEGGAPAGATPEATMDTLMKFGPQHGRNSNWNCSFTMVGVALTYDWLYNDLDPKLREQVRQALWQHARAMYYGGHLGHNPGEEVWNAVPEYNHRWFRDWGLTFAALTASDGKPEDQWLLGRIEKELQFMNDWLPADGSNHEGPGYGGSSGALGQAFQASDECTGTHYLNKPFFKQLGGYVMTEAAPDLKHAMYYADCATNANSINIYALKTAADNHQLDVLDGLRQLLKVNAQNFGVHQGMWLALLTDDPNQAGGDFKKLPTTQLFPDLGYAVVRDGWEDNAVGASFKCSPPGGYLLNSWRETKKDASGHLPYITVAHDHPDANSFAIFGDGDYMAETDRYPLYPGKHSSALNTILVNGLGQVPDGRPEGEGWLQPSSHDMTKMGVLTAWKDAGDVVVAEGEAAGSYLPYTDAKTKASRPALDRFRRTFVWIKGGYLMALDDVRAAQPVDITWLMQGQKLAPVDAAAGTYQLQKNNAQCTFQLAADKPLQSKMGVSMATDHNKRLNWQQLQATANGQAVRFVSVFDPWHHGDLKLTFTPDGPDKATVKIVGKGVNDTWKWQAAAGPFAPSTIHGSRAGGFDVTLDPATAVAPNPLETKSP